MRACKLTTVLPFAALLSWSPPAAAQAAPTDLLLQQAYLKASNTTSGDWLGTSVAIEGDTAIIGANGEDSSATGVNGNQDNDGAADSGAAYVFVRSGTAWIQQAYLKADIPCASTGFGSSVAISGDSVVVGMRPNPLSGPAIGSAYVFRRSGGTWIEEARLNAPASQTGDDFGSAVAISGDTVIVGAASEDSGATGVNGDQLDNSVFASGAAYVFVRDGQTWTQQAYLKASHTGELLLFGESVAISGDTAVVGAVGDFSSATGVNGDQNDMGAPFSGAAYVFVRSGGTWSEQAWLKASNTGYSDEFGGSVAISGDTVVVGARLEGSGATGVNGDQSDDSVNRAGAAYVFARSGAAWSQQAYLKPAHVAAHNDFGLSVSVSGDAIAVGGYGQAGVAFATGIGVVPNSGSVNAFRRIGDTWVALGQLELPEVDPSDAFGAAVAVGGDTLLVGSYCEDSSATGVNGDMTDEGAENSGAARILTGIGSAVASSLDIWAPGSVVTISGAGFDGGAKPKVRGVHAGKKSAITTKVLAWSDTFLTVAVQKITDTKAQPADGMVWDLSITPKGKHAGEPIVIAGAITTEAPTVIDVSPSSGAPGEELQIRVAHLGTKGKPKVTIGGKKAAVKSIALAADAEPGVSGPISIVHVLIPKSLANGLHDLTLANGVGKATVEGAVTVIGSTH